MKKFAPAFMFALLALGAWIFSSMYEFLNTVPDPQGRSVVFEVEPGPFQHIAKGLLKNGLITSEFRFLLLARASGQIKNVRIGEYALKTSMLPREILDTLVSGKSIEHSLTVREGDNIFEIADLIAKKDIASREEVLSLCRNPVFIRELLNEDLPSLEGYLFPETYRFTKYTGVKRLLKTMVQNFLHQYGVATEQNNSYNFDRHDVVTLASMIEKETGAPEERPLISSVFHNRLRKKMKLQSDPTIVYGLWVDTGNMIKNITRQHLTMPHRYSTYSVDALPFGPISNPGLESLKAVLSPATSDYLYFVSRNDGTHVFSRSYEEHASAVRSFQQTRSARQGKSWRNRVGAGNR